MGTLASAGAPCAASTRHAPQPSSPHMLIHGRVAFCFESSCSAFHWLRYLLRYRSMWRRGVRFVPACAATWRLLPGRIPRANGTRVKTEVDIASQSSNGVQENGGAELALRSAPACRVLRLGVGLVLRAMHRHAMPCGASFSAIPDLPRPAPHPPHRRACAACRESVLFACRTS